MKFEIFKYKCKTCNTTFTSPSFPGEIYGILPLRTQSSETAYISVGEPCQEFDEVSKIVDNNPLLKGFNDSQIANIFQEIFGQVACDLSPLGETYHMDHLPYCPNCGSDKVSSKGPIEPIEMTQDDIPSVTHKIWHQLSQQQKQERVDTAIKEFLADPENLSNL